MPAWFVLERCFYSTAHLRHTRHKNKYWISYIAMPNKSSWSFVSAIAASDVKPVHKDYITGLRDKRSYARNNYTSLGCRVQSHEGAEDGGIPVTRCELICGCCL